MNAVTLRPALLRDADDIARLSATLIEHGLAPSWSAARVRRHIRHPESVVLVADFLGLTVGFAIMDFGVDTAHLDLLAVSPGQRRRGVGRSLVGWLETTALTAGTFVVRLEVRATNAQARAFYESLGYAEIARVRGYYQGIEDAVRMQRDVRTATRPAPAP